MRFRTVHYPQGVPIEGYGADFFRIGGEMLQGAIVVAPDGVAPWGGYDDIAPLLTLTGKLDVLLIGTGGETQHLPPSLRAALQEAGLNAEQMGSAAACRTYNVLLGEGRRVGAALLPVGNPAR